MIRLVNTEGAIIDFCTEKMEVKETDEMYCLDADTFYCFFQKKDWHIAEVKKNKELWLSESELFRNNLRDAIYKRGYTASGLSRSLGKSASWLPMIIEGRRRLPVRHHSTVEAELGLQSGTLSRWRLGYR